MGIYQLYFCPCDIALIRLMLVEVTSNPSSCLVILHVVAAPNRSGQFCQIHVRQGKFIYTANEIHNGSSKCLL